MFELLISFSGGFEMLEAELSFFCYAFGIILLVLGSDILKLLLLIEELWFILDELLLLLLELLKGGSVFGIVFWVSAAKFTFLWSFKG